MRVRPPELSNSIGVVRGPAFAGNRHPAPRGALWLKRKNVRGTSLSGVEGLREILRAGRGRGPDAEPLGGCLFAGSYTNGPTASGSTAGEPYRPPDVALTAGGDDQYAVPPSGTERTCSQGEVRDCTEVPPPKDLGQIESIYILGGEAGANIVLASAGFAFFQPELVLASLYGDAGFAEAANYVITAGPNADPRVTFHDWVSGPAGAVTKWLGGLSGFF